MPEASGTQTLGTAAVAVARARRIPVHLVAAGAQLDAVRRVDVAQTDGTGAAAARRLDVVGASAFRAMSSSSESDEASSSGASALPVPATMRGDSSGEMGGSAASTSMAEAKDAIQLVMLCALYQALQPIWKIMIGTPCSCQVHTPRR